jgi:CrcB protein
VTALAVALGGGLGALLRYWTATAVQSWRGADVFPWGTLVVNVVGCFAMGVVAALVERRLLVAPEARAFVAVGVLGGFTTFSAFAQETSTAFRTGAPLVAVANVAASLALCLLAVSAGRFVAARLLP